MNATPTPLPNQWVVWDNGEQLGPFTRAQLQGLVASGEISDAAVVRREDDKDLNWQPLGKALSPKHRLPIGVKLCIGFGALMALLLLLGIIVGPQPPNDREAYDMATRLVMKDYPGAEKFSPYEDWRVKRDASNTWLVGFTVDGKNAFGGPVRNDMAVAVRYDPGTEKWYLEGVHRR